MTKLLTEDAKRKIAKFERNLRRIFDALKNDEGVSDIPFAEFRAEFITLGDPGKIQADLAAMKLRNQLNLGKLN